jgi:acyl carrier protein
MKTYARHWTLIPRPPNVLIGLDEALGVEIPEGDYGQLTTLADIMSYLSARLR